MRKATLLTLLTLALALTTLADDENRHQSYISYDDGGTVVRGQDGQEADAHRNLPIYPGDEIITARRGRAEIRLSDGNIIGIDRATALRFRSILDSYEGEDDETVAELRYGKVAVHRTDIGRDHVRLDTENASYVADNEAVYSVETNSRGSDRVTVFDGSVEVRTPERSTRLRRGESANVDDRGVYDLVGDQRSAADDFERWFLRRAERFGSYNSRYMDRRLSYWADDLDDHGRWVYITGIGYSWRPFVSVGWRPYYHGYWHYSRYGCLTWVSYDPWGWGPYHYGRWAYDPGYGWVWVPGLGYSPAWVYWWYGSGYIGWAPSGWWDCYRPYYNWAYRPYSHWGGRHGYGFYGRVKIGDMDLRPWTFVDSRGIISTRIDRAALTTDAVKNRLARSRDGFATIGAGNARLTREEWNDPADVIRRRGIEGRQTGRETGAPPTDVTPFFRRDPTISSTVRDRVVRSRGGSTTTQPGGSLANGGTGSIAPIGGGSVAPIGRGSVAPIAPGSPTEGRRAGDTTSGRVPRVTPNPPADSGSSGGTSGGTISRDRGDSGWRDRGGRDTTPEIGRTTPSTSAPPSTDAPSIERPKNDSWRARPRSDSSSTSSDSGRSRGSSYSGSSGSSDVPRRVIEGISGARIRPRSDSGSASSGSGSRDRGSSSSTRQSGSSGSRDSGRASSGRSSSGSRDSGRASSGSSSSGSRDSGRASSGSSSSGSSSRGSGSASRGDSGGRVKRD
jgi:hypothetical protein